MSDTDEHPKVKGVAFDWRVVGLVALMGGGGLGTWGTAAFSGPAREEIARLTSSVEKVGDEVQALTTTIEAMKSDRRAGERESATTLRRLDDHEERLRILERKVLR